jgi:hypothetical protein
MTLQVYKSLSADIIEGLLAESGSLLIRAVPGLTAPFAFELSTCLAAGVPFFGRQVEKRAVRFVSRRSGYHMRLARAVLAGTEIKFACGSASDHVAEHDGVRDQDGFTVEEIADYWTGNLKPGAVVVASEIQAALGIRSTPDNVRDLCNALATTAAERGIALVVAMDASESDGDHFRPLIHVFASHAVAAGSPNDGGNWWMPHSMTGPVGHGGAFTVRNVTIGEQSNGAALVVPSVIDPATCCERERYITLGARGLVA